ncbi:MAG: hypothetical protein II221_01160, partial [Paludibacteraceae bacterium]|nr:hypothetical protein [Paludibacteraceae bacterium]
KIKSPTEKSSSTPHQPPSFAPLFRKTQTILIINVIHIINRGVDNYFENKLKKMWGNVEE